MIACIDGWWWPESDVRARPVITGDCDAAIAELLPHVRGRACIVQAGGNVGVYPIALAKHFDRVVTVEPDPENYACLWRNALAHDAEVRVEARHAAFGERGGTCRVVEVEPNNCGAHRVEPDGGLVMLTIDSLMLNGCDAIWLDVEGYELPALKGASLTIERFSPTICIEDKGLDKVYGAPPGASVNWLGQFGYRQVGKIGRDRVFTRNA